MIKVYVAGAYSDDNVMGVLRNIGRGQYWAGRLFMEGFAPFCPWHDRTYVFDNFSVEIPVSSFYKYSMEWLKASDVVFVVPNQPGLKDWEESKGTVAEISEARKNRIPVVYSLEDLRQITKELQDE